MKRSLILLTLVLLVVLVAVPMGLCSGSGSNSYNGDPRTITDRPLAEVKVVGALCIPPVIRLKVNNTEAIAKGTRGYDLEWENPMLLEGDYPTPTQTAYAASQNYKVQVYSNDEWSFFMWRTDIEKISFDATEKPGFEFSKENGAFQNFPANQKVEYSQYNTPTDNDYRLVGNYKFRAKYDAGSEPGLYAFVVGFVAYQE